MITTKIYRNIGDTDVTVVGVGEIPAGEQLSITTEYHQPVVLANYPMLVEITAEGFVESETTKVSNKSASESDVSTGKVEVSE